MASKFGTLLQTIRHDYDAGADGNVTTAAFTELDAALDEHVSEIEIFDSSGQDLFLAYADAGNEVAWLRIFPGGNDRGPAMMSKGVRLAIKAVSANATGGVLLINLWGR